jgi:mRNA interferase RelE/StbE
LGLSYRIEYLESVVREDIPRLSKDVRNRVRKAIEQKLASHPVEFGKPLRYSLKGARRLRVVDWRVVYTIEPPDVVLIVKIGLSFARLPSEERICRR